MICIDVYIMNLENRCYLGFAMINLHRLSLEKRILPKEMSFPLIYECMINVYEIRTCSSTSYISMNEETYICIHIHLWWAWDRKLGAYGFQFKELRRAHNYRHTQLHKIIRLTPVSWHVQCINNSTWISVSQNKFPRTKILH